MEIRRITEQSQPLEEHYTFLVNNERTSPDYAEVGRWMLELLRHLPTINGPSVWAVTSHVDLHLVASDDYRQPSLVVIRCGGYGEAFGFSIEYPMPSSEAP